jgi:hypothetical protein
MRLEYIFESLAIFSASDGGFFECDWCRRHCCLIDLAVDESVNSVGNVIAVCYDVNEGQLGFQPLKKMIALWSVVSSMIIEVHLQ